MNMIFKDGILTINGKPVKTIVFTDESTIVAPFDVNDDLHIENSGFGGKSVTNSKNVFTGSISTGGSFRIGDDIY